MKNTCNINTDNTNVNIFTEIHINTSGKIFLLITNSLIWPAIILCISLIPADQIKNIIVRSIILCSLINGRYTLWNLWGKEFIRINTKSISYWR